ncbi:hypothetical protein L207DRAFT_508707 [Hyaloscypha variabilis F]|uniref:Uncharacterized protein n=1 Tax=Hyaloscypha variabilis (strain UAMH 11265 / GT02V1 / F) TaxID=1149755 RepID=A0A2J6RZK1_HYAVF|nr:hypothetical protein L207DRAFT_508707 [Hyaloscypha variabilis F]
MKSSDPQPTHVVWSLTDEETRSLEPRFGFHEEPVVSPQRDGFSSYVPRNDESDAQSVLPPTELPRATDAQTEIFASQTTSDHVPFDPFRSESPPPSQELTLFDRFSSFSPPAFDPFRSVSPPPSQQLTDFASLPAKGEQPNLPLPSSGNTALASSMSKEQLSGQPAPQLDQKEQPISRTPSPQQSDCFASNSQTPRRSETPPTPVNFDSTCSDDFALPDDIFGSSNFDSDSGHETTLEVEHHQQRPFATNVILHGSQQLASSKQPPGSNHSQAQSVIDLTAESSSSTSTSLRTGPYHHFPGGQNVWSPNTPIQSIECQRGTHQPPPKFLVDPRGYQPFAKAKQPELSFREQLRNYIASRSESQAKGESRVKHEYNKRNKSANANPPQTRLDPSTALKVSTFMKLRNSLPIAALIAMMAPPNQTQVLATLAELSDIQTPPGTPQPATHELPAAMRAMLDNLMQKLNSDKAFLKSVITYASEQVMKNAHDQEESIDRKNGIESGLDELGTLTEAREQLLKERAHFHEILSTQEYMVSYYKKQNSRLNAIINANNSASKFGPEPQPELNVDGSIKKNPFWVCGNLMLDGSGAKCNGINQVWHRHHCQRRDLPARWTLRQSCVKCGRPNNNNRRYLADDEARMFTTYVSQQQAPVGLSPQPSAMFPQFMAHSVPMVPQPMPAMSPMAQYPVAPATPATPPMTQTPMIQTNLAMPQIVPPPIYKSPYAPEPLNKRKASEPAALPSAKRSHPGFNISPAVQDALRRELPQKEWMKPKKAVREGPDSSAEPIAIDEEATTEDSGTSEDDMASLFGDDENENGNMNDVDEFEAALNEALDEALASLE